MKMRFLSWMMIVTLMTTACTSTPSPIPPPATSAPTLASTASATLAPTPAPTFTPTAANTPRPAPTLPSAEAFHINPIEGLRPDFIMGADVSMLSQIEASGGKFYEAGVETDALEILRDHGVNWIRLRIWNDPTSQDGKPLGGGNNDLPRTIAIAARAKALGLKFLLDFHYSDWWADPGKQNLPKAWVGLEAPALQQAVYDYTAEVMQALTDAGATPDMVQIGNEVNGGMMWPAGKTWAQGNEVVGGYDGFAALLARGIQAVRDNDPTPQQPIRIAIHLADGGDNDLYRTVFDALTERNVDFDIIGLSYYSFWHGPLDRFVSNLNDISARYQKEVVVLEAAYPYVLADADGYGNLVGGDAQALNYYKPTVQGQATALRDIMAALAQVPQGLGLFYWEPEWIAVEGAGWAAGQGNAWENLALFDFDGNALPSLDVFNLARPGYGGAVIAPQVVAVKPIEVYVPLSETPELPATVAVAYSDDAIRSVAVTWDFYPPVFLEKVGSFILNGAIEGTEEHVAATIYTGSAKNYVVNAGFEQGLDPWVVAGSVNTVDISEEAQNLRNGKRALHYWVEGAFAFTVAQTITGLENGAYTLSLWTHGGGSDALQLSASDYGGAALVVDFVNKGWVQWQNPTLANIVVTNGQCTIRLHVTSPGGTWGFVEDVQLVRAGAP